MAARRPPVAQAVPWVGGWRLGPMAARRPSTSWAGHQASQPCRPRSGPARPPSTACPAPKGGPARAWEGLRSWSARGAHEAAPQLPLGSVLGPWWPG
eukprot:8645460-Alexandrium_andersonii.AAC.1